MQQSRIAVCGGGKDTVGGGGSTARRARAQTARSKSTAWGRDERHYSLGWGQSSRIDDHAFLSWRARETGNESTVEVDVTNGAGEAGCRTTKTARREERRDYAQSQRGIASHVCYGTSSWCYSDGILTERLEPTKDSRSNVFSTSSFSPHNRFSPGQTNIT